MRHCGFPSRSDTQTEGNTGGGSRYCGLPSPSDSETDGNTGGGMHHCCLPSPSDMTIQGSTGGGVHHCSFPSRSNGNIEGITEGVIAAPAVFASYGTFTAPTAAAVLSAPKANRGKRSPPPEVDWLTRISRPQPGPRKGEPPVTTITFDMTDYARDTVRHYCKSAGKGAQIKTALTPFCPEGSLPEKDEEVKGGFIEPACSCLMKGLWICRLGRPDCQKATQCLATHASKWSRNDDKRMQRLMSYLWTTRGFKLIGTIKDWPEELYLLLYVDADFCGETEDTKSTNGAILVLAGPRGTFMPLAWLVKKQTATSRSTTEAEIIAIAGSLCRSTANSGSMGTAAWPPYPSRYHGGQ